MTTTLGRPVAVPPAAPEPEGDDGISVGTQHRLRLLAVSVALTVLAFVQRPGLIAPDTKLDLSVDPIGFLSRAWYLWEPIGGSGQLQNQAYGYFTPMGPFFSLGYLLQLPAWVIQRLWWATVLLVAFHGVYRLLGRMGIGTHPTMIIAALAYALSPRMITEVGPVSIEAWPIAVAPWVLLPLVRVTPGAEATAAARSGIAIAMGGGVNAVAVGAMLPLPVWWLVTRKASAMRRKLVKWWCLAALCGISWWLGPLLMLGRYSPPFLDWVESSEVSTSKASLPSAFRGVTQWVAWFRLPQPIWPAGWSELASPAGILLGWLLIAIAVLGILRRDTPHRIFLIGGSVAGLVLLTMGHVGPLAPPWAPVLRDLMDGPLAPLRNSHKFDLVLRLPLAIGLAHALTVLRLPRLRGLDINPVRALQFTAACAVLGVAAPALLGQIPASGSFKEIPPYWQQAADWLKANDDGGRTLLVPGQPSAESTWGDPTDEPFQPLAQTRWATRDGVPLSSEGNNRMLTIVEQQLATGRGSPGLAEFLARSGVSRLLVRADTKRSFQPGSAPLPVTVRSALEQSPGLSPVVRFGPTIQGRRVTAGQVVDERTGARATSSSVVDDGLDLPVPAIEIWQVDQPTALAEVYDARTVLKVAGGTESLLSMADAGLLGRRPTVLAGDPQAERYQEAPLAVTDTPQKREANVAQVRDLYSSVMTAEQGYRLDRKVHDWLPFDQPQVTARPDGVQDIRALSSAAPTLGPWYAFDGDTTTSWISSQLGVGQWIEVDFARPTELPARIRVTPAPTGAKLSALDVRTDTGTERTQLSQNRDIETGPQFVTVPPGETTKLRITVAGTWKDNELNPVAFSEIDLGEGVTARRPLVLPAPAGGADPQAIALHATRYGADACQTVDGRAYCSPRLQRQAEEGDLDRVLTLPAATEYGVAGTVRVRASPDVEALLRPAGPAVLVDASSRRTNDPEQRPQAVADRSTATGWVASSSDERPLLKLRWQGVRTVDRLRWQVDEDLLASRPSELRVVGPDGRGQTVVPDAQGWVRLERPIRGTAIDIAVTGVDPLMSIDRATGFEAALPVGASEIVVPALDDLRKAVPDWRPVTISCARGPQLTVDGRTVRTRVLGTVGDVLRRQPMAVQPCEPVGQLAAGEHRVRLDRTPELAPDSLTLTRPEALAAAAQAPATTIPAEVRQLNPERRVISVGRSDAEQVLVVHENINAGWRATLGGQRLDPVRIDGWQQGYVVPAGLSGDVQLHFTPGRPYRIIMLSGLAIVFLLALFTLPPRGTRASGGRRGARLAEPVFLAKNGGRRGYGLLGVFGIVALGGGWAVAALLGVLTAVRARVQMRWIVVAACAVAGVGSAVSINADVREGWEGWFGTAAIAASLVVVACMAVRVDSDSDRILTRASLAVARAVSPRRRR